MHVRTRSGDGPLKSGARNALDNVLHSPNMLGRFFKMRRGYGYLVTQTSTNVYEVTTWRKRGGNGTDADITDPHTQVVTVYHMMRRYSAHCRSCPWSYGNLEMLEDARHHGYQHGLASKCPGIVHIHYQDRTLGKVYPVVFVEEICPIQLGA